jgi:apolipoprotein D and lipocalin family protein
MSFRSKPGMAVDPTPSRGSVMEVSGGSSSRSRSQLPPPPRTVDSIDLASYTGKWYEIAKFPTSFQRGCENSTANYTISDDGSIRVDNRCFVDGREVKGSIGKAEVVDGSKLRVNFVPSWLRWLGVGWGDYWIVALDPIDARGALYRTAVVSGPSREYLWILHRYPRIESGEFGAIVDHLAGRDFDMSRLVVNHDAVS